MRGRQQGRRAAREGGEWRLVQETFAADPYIDFQIMCRLHKCMIQNSNGFEKLRDALIMPHTSVERVVNVWIKGDAGVGKTRFVNWFCRYALDQRMYKVPHTTDYKWWDGYMGEVVVHIEEMDPTQKISVSRLKDMLDVTPFRVEKKGFVTKDLRPLVMLFTSNYSPEVVFGQGWDAALESRFSSERFTSKGQSKT